MKITIKELNSILYQRFDTLDEIRNQLEWNIGEKKRNRFNIKIENLHGKYLHPESDYTAVVQVLDLSKNTKEYIDIAYIGFLRDNNDKIFTTSIEEAILSKDQQSQDVFSLNLEERYPNFDKKQNTNTKSSIQNNFDIDSEDEDW